MDATGRDKTDPRRRRRWVLWIKCIVAGLAVLFLFLLLAGLLYQNLASTRDNQTHPPPGELVEVGDYRLHLYCLGSGSPPVVLESGLGGSWLDWDLVQEEIAGFTRVCAYDRAGLGWSDPLASPVQSAQVAASLHTLLDNAGVEGPYVLVGHSIGGVYVRAFADRYPGDVSGMVLLDSSHERQLFHFPAELVSDDALYRLVALCRVVAPFGLMRLARAADLYVVDMPLSPEQREMLAATMYRTRFCRAFHNEGKAAGYDLGQPHPPGDLGDMPLVVLTAGIGFAGADPEDFSPEVTTEMLVQADQTWMELQAELAGLSSDSTHRIAEGSEHYIHHDRPDLVIEAVRQVVDAARR